MEKDSIQSPWEQDNKYFRYKGQSTTNTPGDGLNDHDMEMKCTQKIVRLSSLDNLTKNILVGACIVLERGTPIDQIRKRIEDAYAMPDLDSLKYNCSLSL